jgi:crotonobetainyl-CoA:carnitine CoA-transferase CaiB-like acyl-CoA transferase
MELGHIRVIEASSGIAGAYCAKMFVDGGADVIVAEGSAPSPLRAWRNAPLAAGAAADDGLLFRHFTHGTRAVVVTDPTGWAELLAGADVLILDDTQPEGLGNDLNAIADAHPGLVVVSITHFGRTGPYADRPASELTIQAESGALAIRGIPELPPYQAGGRIHEWVGGAYAAAAALAAALGAQRTGEGEVIDLSLAEVANIASTLIYDLMWSLIGRPPIDPTVPARSLETPSIEPTKDGFVGFNTNAQVMFDGFVEMIGQADNPLWKVRSNVQANEEEWTAAVHAFTKAHTTDEVVAAAVARRIPVAPVTNGRTMVEHPYVIERNIFRPDPTGTFQQPRRAYRFNDEDPPALRPAPRYGQHTGSIEARVPTRPAPSGARGRPLEGVKVLDITGWWAGPSATGALAHLGADVIHVESHKRLDGMRVAAGALFATQPTWWERSWFFLQINTNKRELTLDLSTERGREIVLELVKDADLVVENYTPRVFDDSFNLGWDVIHAVNPRAVMMRMPAFGTTGEWANRPGFAQTMEQMTGLSWVTGHVSDQPRIPRGPCDPNGGMHGAFAAMVALQRRDQTGEGVLVECPLFEAALNIAAEPVIEWTGYGHLLEREGNRGGWAAPQGVYLCDGPEQWLALSVLNDDQWAGLAKVIDATDLAADPAYATHAGRLANHDAIDAAITAWAGGRSAAAAADELVAAGVPAATLVDQRNVFGHPQFDARGYFEMVDHAVVGTHPTPGQPYRFRSIDRWIMSPAPLLGEHNAEILRDIGLTDEGIAALEADGVIGTEPKF